MLTKNDKNLSKMLFFKLRCKEKFKVNCNNFDTKLNEETTVALQWKPLNATILALSEIFKYKIPRLM